MRKLASIREISGVSPIAGADRIELLHIDGWQCVSKKGSIKVDDKVVYFEIDSALPVDDSRYEFLKERCHKKFMSGQAVLDECIRIRTIRLKGQVSQGLALPLGDFPELEWLSVGTDVSETLGVRHYDEVKEAFNDKIGNNRIGGDAKGSFPHYIVPKTDEERLQNLYSLYSTNPEITELAFECTEKADGSSMTFIYAPKIREEEPFFVCSRNLELKESETNVFWNVANKLGMKTKVQEYCELFFPEGLAIQGELVGPGINSNRDKYTDFDLKVFRIYDIGKKQWIKPVDRVDICENIGLNHVRVLCYKWRVFSDLKSFDEFLEFVRGNTVNGNVREGCVWKSEDGNISFKLINNDYL